MESILHTFGVDWHLLFAQGVNFLILAALLTWLLYKPVQKIVKEREAVIAKGVDDAERAAEALKSADTEAAKRVEKAETEADDILGGAREAATLERSRIVKEAESRAASIAEDAEARAKEQQAKALRESEKEIARLAVLAAEKVLRK